ncbi:MAG: alpha/beta hydrolase [Alphaproteobacteria bacterium]|nr:alpha/beta hydrolase [Alphaproteobacteria bacterium]NNF24034.1 alpha/beta fold hydrolase [Paracoccaceae bacterium]
MMTALTWAARGLALLVLAALVLVLFGPREAVDTTVEFDPADVGSDVDAYLAAQEARFDDIVPGTQKRVIWAGAPNARTRQSVLFIHGFSATSEEVWPVPDLVAEALGANLVFARLAGHGRGSAAMAEPEAGDWIEDAAEALAVARAVGEGVIVISNSTGGTLSAIAALRPEMSQNVEAFVFMSPNFGLNSFAAPILNWPGGRYWAPVVAGPERRFKALNPEHDRFWTLRYPTIALLPMSALVDYAAGLDYSAASQPALFMFSESDMVVDPDATRRIAGYWGGPVTLAPQVLGEGDDPYSHVLAGDILSPGMTSKVATQILKWIESL